MTENYDSHPYNEDLAQERTIFKVVGANDSIKVAIMALMTALETVATSILSVNIPQTNGYFNLGECIIFITAILFGAYIGAFVGGVGASLADVFLGYFSFAPITLIVKGLEGFFVGWVYDKIRKNPNKAKRFGIKFIAILCGAPFMVGGYFLAEFFIFNLGWGAAAELIPNLIQVGMGALIAIPITLLLEEIPQIDQLRESILMKPSIAQPEQFQN
ncbi:MAG: ECF transporter S component [Candidatus Lokiarchaeota archaeon]|nr:ECF transporter S component [Candidatus Harpocratesius repetitus]